jgi:hypothetical protein
MISVLKLHQECPTKQGMKNHEESNKFRDESRESTPERSSPALGLKDVFDYFGFPRAKDITH